VGAIANGFWSIGALYARVFKMFLRGDKSLPEVAVALELPAEQVLAFREEYDNLGDAITIGGEAFQRLKAALGAPAVKDGESLLAALSVWLKPRLVPRARPRSTRNTA
jgi:hypothetical protein